MNIDNAIDKVGIVVASLQCQNVTRISRSITKATRSNTEVAVNPYLILGIRLGILICLILKTLIL